MSPVKNEPASSLKRRHLLESGQELPFVGRDFSPPALFKDMEFRPVQSVDELKAACRLVYEEYVKLDYMDPNQAQFKFTLFQTVPTTTTFVAVYKKKQVVGTITAVMDSPLGLPMEQLYKQELNHFRTNGHRLFEATMFAVDAEKNDLFETAPTRGEKLLMVLYLIAGMFDYMRTFDLATTVVGCWHPRHEILYQFMQMRPFGDLKAHASVKGSPAVARFLDFREGLRHVSVVPSQQFFFGRPLASKESYAPKPLFTLADLDPLFIQSSRPPHEPPRAPEPAPKSVAASLGALFKFLSANKSQKQSEMVEEKSISTEESKQIETFKVLLKRLPQGSPIALLCDSPRMQILTKVARSLHLNVILLATTSELALLENVRALVVERSRDLEQVPDELLEQLELVVVMQPPEFEEDTCYDALFNPPVTTPGMLYHWDEVGV